MSRGVALPPSTAAAQQPGLSTGATSPAAPPWLFPDRALLPDLLAGPRDPTVLARLVYDDPSPTAYGPAEPAIPEPALDREQ